MKKRANSSISLKNIHITDAFWDKYIRLVKDVIIPYQWDILNDNMEGVETSHCLENFRIAAGEKEGEYYGAVFQDTDVAKWLEAVGFVLNWGRDEALEKLADETISLIGRAQQPDGYLNTYFTIKEPEKRWKNLTEGHELYTAGHMIEAAVAYYESTGKKEFLDIVSRFADLICDTFGAEEGKIHGYPGHQEIELALVKLYRVTGRRAYLETAKYFIDARGVGENYFLREMQSPQYRQIMPDFSNYDPAYSQSDVPVREQERAEGHAVRAVYMYCAMADLALETEDPTLMDACVRLWDDMVHRQMYITGSIGSSGILERFTTDYDLPNDCNYSETCASIGLAQFGKRMGDITKDASYMDVAERALYNTLLSGIAMDGKSFFYVNPLEVWPANCMDRTSKEHVKPVRQSWYGVACCPPNITRTLASLGQYMYYQEKDRIYTNLFIANRTETEVDGVRVELELEGDFPWKNQFKFHVRAEKQTDMSLYFRMPDYARSFRIIREGAETGFAVENGYARVDGCFLDDCLEISFEAPAQFVHANPQVRADVGKTALVRGPLVYCLEETDNGANLASLFVRSDEEIREEYDSQLLGGCQILRVGGRKVSDDGWDGRTLYRGSCPPVLEETELTFVPYCYWGNRDKGEMLVWLKELFR
ncbi:MAG TPA: glycoside hydrolase family 127 protein [Candidatus Mediterraneibacter tabaqchaliae]|uniref:Glycoside hydrolase family 127 protein n=1 Tax=Candidatus Mediterraneibacter tabaqchaliae TaxID=2838689 RepID=A0A9D2U0H6_9FIRM|nr:glycoside hydrolase family 127 protein [Candidatus Mediterraneibacter tabaqchaliae]